MGQSAQGRQEETGREYEQSTMVNMYTNSLPCIQLKNKRWQGAGYVQKTQSTLEAEHKVYSHTGTRRLGGGDKKAANKRLTRKAESQAWVELLGKLRQETFLDY